MHVFYSSAIRDYVKKLYSYSAHLRYERLIVLNCGLQVKFPSVSYK